MAALSSCKSVADDGGELFSSVIKALVSLKSCPETHHIEENLIRVILTTLLSKCLE